MQISSIFVENYRALHKVSMNFEQMTAIIGENNAGKSAFLRALDLFFSTAPKVSVDDFHHGNVNETIDITVHFVNLTKEELDIFDTNLLDGELIVTRRLISGNPRESGQFFVEAEVFPAFTECRHINGKRDKVQAYKELQKTFNDLPNVSAADDVDACFEEWEQAHPELLERERVAGFRGFKEVAVSKLKSKTEFVYVPAVRDAQQEVGDDKSSPVRQLLNTIARQAFENNLEYAEFLDEAKHRLRELTDPGKVDALGNIGDALTTILARYYGDATISASWSQIDEVSFPVPSPDLSVQVDGHITPVEFVGHGLQRAVILTVLEYASRTKFEGEGQRAFDEAQSDIIIALEEPELYQHPIKQRLFAQVLSDLASSYNKETGIRIQIVIATHSPLFVALPRFNQVRLIRKEMVGGVPQVTVASSNISDCAKAMAQILDVEPNESRYVSSLHIFTPEIAEGFFAKKVVLVEGVSDHAILIASYLRCNRNPLAEGIFIVAVGGKGNFDKPLQIFSNLGIKTYVVFDNDKEKRKSDSEKRNITLQKLIGCDKSEIVEWPDIVGPRFTAIPYKLETVLCQVAGKARYDEVCNELASETGISARDATKSPVAASTILFRFAEANVDLTYFDQIVERIDEL